MRKNLKRVLAIMLSVAVLLSTMVMFVSAAPVKVYKYHSSNAGNGNTYIFYLKEQVNGSGYGDKIPTYCVNKTKNMDDNNSYHAYDLSVLKANNVRAIIYGSYPSVKNLNDGSRGSEPLSGPDSLEEKINAWAGSDSSKRISKKEYITEDEAITATQYAIWHFTNNYNPSVDNTYKKVYDYLINLAPKASQFVLATASASNISFNTVDIASKAYTKLTFSYPVNAVGKNSAGDNVYIPLEHNITNLPTSSTTEKIIDNDIVNVTVRIPEIGFGNADSIIRNLKISGTKTQIQDEALQFTTGLDTQDLVGFTSKEHDVTSSTNITIPKPVRNKLETEVLGDGFITLDPVESQNNYIAGKSVTVTATAKTGSAFVEWYKGTGYTALTAASTSVVMDTPKKVKAIFNYLPVAINDDKVCNLTKTSVGSTVVNVLANDSDKDGNNTLSIKSVGDCSHGSASIENGQVKYVHNSDDKTATEDSFNYVITDGKAEATATVTITLTRTANVPPIAVDDTKALNLDKASVGSTVVNVIGNDSDTDGTIKIDSVGTCSHGTASIENGQVKYVHDSNDKTATKDSFEYTIIDDDKATATATVTINLTRTANVPPIAVDDTKALNLDKASVGSTVVNVIGNDSDTDGTIKIDSVGTCSHGTASIENGQVKYVHDSDDKTATSDSFEYTIIDDDKATATATVTITLTRAANVPPVAVNDTATLKLNKASEGNTVVAVLENDSDTDGTIKIASVGECSHGTASIENGQVKYVHDSKDITANSDSFEYTIIDDDKATATATVTITLKRPANVPPVAVDDTKTLNLDKASVGSTVVNVTGNDSDTDGTIKIDSVGTCSHGTVSIENGQVKYVHDSNDKTATSDSFEYTIIDDDKATATATVTITLTRTANVAPVAVKDAATLNLDESSVGSIVVNVIENDSDTDGTIKIDSVGACSHGTASIENGQVKYVHDSDDKTATEDSFEYTIIDDDKATAKATVTITLTRPEIHKDPIANKDSYSVYLKDGKGSVKISPLDNDVSYMEDKTLYFRMMPGPIKGHFDSETMMYTYTGTISEDSITDTINYNVLDRSENRSNIATITITIYKEKIDQTPTPTDAPKPTDVPAPTEAPKPTDVPAPTEAPKPTDVPVPTAIPTPEPTAVPAPEYVAPVEPTFNLSVSVVGEGSVMPDAGNHSFSKDSRVIMQVTPATGWKFDRWDGDALDNGQMVMSGNKSVTAVFVQEVVVTPEPAPAGPVATPIPEPTATPVPVKEEAAVVVVEEKAPAGPAELPKTGGIPAGLFYGLGGLITAAGLILNKKRQK